jgi:hypothetical protein
VKKGCQRVDEFEREYAHFSIKLKDVTIQLKKLNIQICCNEVWIEGLVKQIYDMHNRASVHAFPLPIKNPTSMPTGSSSVVFDTLPTSSKDSNVSFK